MKLITSLIIITSLLSCISKNDDLNQINDLYGVWKLEKLLWNNRTEIDFDTVKHQTNYVFFNEKHYGEFYYFNELIDTSYYTFIDKKIFKYRINGDTILKNNIMLFEDSLNFISLHISKLSQKNYIVKCNNETLQLTIIPYDSLIYQYKRIKPI